jgi:hypothetical protein
MMTSGGAPLRRRLGLAILLTMTACRGGCRGGQGELSRDPALRLMPAQTTVVLSLDFRRVRQTTLWKQLAQLAGDDPDDKRLIDGMVAATGFDPFTQVHRLVAGFPEEARRSRAFAVVFEGDKIDRARMLAYVQADARRRGGEVVVRSRKGREFWASPTWSPALPASASPDATGAGDDTADAGGTGVAGFFLDDHHFVLGGGGWAERMADLADGPGPRALDEPAFARLVDRVARGRSIWLAAVVPAATRARLIANPRFGADAAVMRFGASADLGPALAADLVAELSNQADARGLVDKVNAFVAAAKKSSEVLLLGVAPYLDGVKAEVDGPDARIRVQLPAAQTEELVTRLVGFLRLRRGAH